MGTSSTKIKALMGRILLPDPRTYTRRFLQALSPCALFFFIYMFFGPLELIASNANLLGFDVIRALPWYAGAFIILTLLSSALAALLRGSLFDDATSLVFALSIASYIQCNWLNPEFGRQDGHQIIWTNFPRSALLNLLFWLFCIAVIWVLRALMKKHWPKAVSFVSVLLILMQSVGLAWLVSDQMRIAEEESVPYRFSLDEQLYVSKDQNILVFYLDALSNRSMQGMLEKYPDALSSMHDFTYYDNCAPIFYGTFPSVIYTLTGDSAYDPAASYKTFERQAWGGEKAESFYALLKENHYVCSIYNEEDAIAHSYALLEGKIDNAIPLAESQRINIGEMYKRIGYLTLFRYFPLGLKACYWATIDTYAGILREDENDRWGCFASTFYDALETEGLTLSEENRLTVYHFWGAHPPFILDADCRLMDDTIADTSADQCRGHFTMLEAYFSQMRELGVYDDAIIVILADHGDTGYDGSYAGSSTVCLVKMPGERHDALKYNSAPVTHMELLPTFVSTVDAALAADFGDTLSDIPDAPRVRSLWCWAKTDALTTGTYDHFLKFNYDYHIDELVCVDAPDESYLLYDSFY